jgi:hypothetical protein
MIPRLERPLGRYPMFDVAAETSSKILQLIAQSGAQISASLRSTHCRDLAGSNQPGAKLSVAAAKAAVVAGDLVAAYQERATVNPYRPYFYSFVFIPYLALAQQPDVAPTELEAFVSNPSVIVENEALVGQLGSLDSVIRIFAIEAQDRSNPGSISRGARIELANNAWNETVYLDAPQLAELSHQLNMMMIGTDSQRKKQRPNWPLTIGTELCWKPDAPLRILCPSYSIDKVGETLAISVYGARESFPFPGNQLVDLAQFVEAAAKEVGSEQVFEEGDPTQEIVDSSGPEAGLQEDVVSLEIDPVDRSGDEADLEAAGITASSSGRGTHHLLLLIAGAAFGLGAVALLYSLASKRHSG